LADRVERGGHSRKSDTVDFDQVQHHMHPPDGAKAKYREGERLFKIAQAQSLFVVKIAHFGTFICGFS
jgi:hypothetical protein